MTLLFDRLISDSGVELARLFDDARDDLDDVLDETSTPTSQRTATSRDAQLQ